MVFVQELNIIHVGFIMMTNNYVHYVYTYFESCSYLRDDLKVEHDFLLV